MAKRRFLSKDIVRSDAFVDMPLSTQALYMHLMMEADDDGFVGNPKLVIRLVGANEDDLKVLMLKRFVLVFPTGIIVIKHFKMQNTIPPDRYTATVYREELAQLRIKDNRSYTELEHVEISMPFTECQHNVNTLETQYRLDKSRLDKNSIEKEIYAQSANAESAAVIVYKIPLQSKKENPIYHNVFEDDIEHYRELYPAVDIDAEIRKMIGWCEANPAKRKTPRGVRAFITTWLSKEQDKGGRLKGISQKLSDDEWLQGGRK